MSVTRTAVAALVVSSWGWIPASAQDARPASLVGPAEAGPEGSCTEPVQVVAGFLHLAPEQVQAFAQLLHVRQATLGPILHEIAVREQRIRELVASGGNPAEIGVLVVQVHHLRQAAAAAQAQFLDGFSALLNETQRAAWEQVRVAARLQPVLPAFQALQVL